MKQGSIGMCKSSLINDLDHKAESTFHKLGDILKCNYKTYIKGYKQNETCCEH